MSNLPSEPEFEQALNELSTTLTPFLEQNPEYNKAFEIIQIPERIIQFRVVWEDDNHVSQVNRGYRVQFNSALGPYKGGLRLHETVNLSVLKFLGFEQIFKNALTGLNIGGGKGGSDFNPKGKSDGEVRRFCKAFATELQRHIGPNTDVPAGDIGFSTREAGFVFGTYKQLKNEWTGVITGKAMDWGGSNIRPEATGYGLIYYVEHMINHVEKSLNGFKGKKVVISGSGNVAQFAALKVLELGGTVVSLSDSKGSLIAKQGKGFTSEMISKIAQIKYNRGELSSFGDASGALEFHQDKRPWTLISSYDVALPCATQNELNEQEAKFAISAGCRYVAEGSNMGLTQSAIDVFENSRLTSSNACWYGPGKAANSGGVAVSGLEMAQNSARLTWSHEEVDQKLKDIMKNAYQNCFETGKNFPAKGDNVAQNLPSLVGGANIAGFKKVADAMREHGDWF
ncbi:probable NADP-specific glutamate dehydrogenase [Melanopsichium pennsylvanicum]|uniref:Glutamate dehydrogenase n=2 Tax=Melanopsichium pennsylvanicum TaxID=63383 RepID=A0AAJ5C5A4_9BASI|nr:probable NADP-specific glutamate dehydrogenase [Melanopsichium pennsylvanicum 4]SNX84527.1 probable NADP-specific glutamate dehydrogenase [Melanopsichium pennsylvanicum]